MESVYHPTASARLNLATTGSLITVREMLRCFGGNLVGERKRYSRKCLELSVGGICPFNGVHVLCQRCKCLERRPSAERSVSVSLSLLRCSSAAGVILFTSVGSHRNPSLLLVRQRPLQTSQPILTSCSSGRGMQSSSRTSSAQKAVRIRASVRISFPLESHRGLRGHSIYRDMFTY